MSIKVAIIGLGIMGTRMLTHMRLHEKFKPDYLRFKLTETFPQLKKLKIFNLVMTLKVEKLQVYSNLKQLTKYMITKVLPLQVVTLLKKMVNLLWLKIVRLRLKLIEFQLFIH